MKPTNRVPRIVPLVVVLIAAIAAGCGGNSSPMSTSDRSTAALSPDAKQGKSIAAGTCLGCHTTNGSGSAGPTFKGLAGSTVKLSNGQTIVADDGYLTESIQNPAAKIVSGYPKTMSVAIPKGAISDEQAKGLVAYIDSLK